MRLLKVLFFAIVLSTVAAAGIISPQVKKCVAFIFVQDSTGTLQPAGTGFFVGIESKTDSITFIYFVTAKHVIKDTTQKYLDRIFIRLNKRSGNSDTLALNLFHNGRPVFFIHPDPTVDIAVIPMAPDVRVYDYMYIPSDMITTRELFRKENIQAGDDVFFTGLFLSHFGRSINLPIVRFGKVALISDEKVLWNRVLTELYLIETTSYGGNSGSPLFFNFEPTRIPGVIEVGKPRLYLAGILIGYFYVSTVPDWIETKRKFLWAFENSGIAAVVPAYQLDDILHSTLLEEQRKRQ